MATDLRVAPVLRLKDLLRVQARGYAVSDDLGLCQPEKRDCPLGPNWDPSVQ